MPEISARLTDMQDRVERAVLRIAAPNPILGITLHTLERALEGRADDQLSKFATEVLASHSPRERALIRRILTPLISTLKFVSERARVRMIPEDLDDLTHLESFSTFITRRRVRLLPHLDGRAGENPQVAPILLYSKNGHGAFGWMINGAPFNFAQVSPSGNVVFSIKQYLKSITPDNVFRYGEEGTLHGSFKRPWMTNWTFSVSFVPYEWAHDPDSHDYLLPEKAVKATVLEVKDHTIKFKLPIDWPQPTYTAYAVKIRASQVIRGQDIEESNILDTYVYPPLPILAKPVITSIEPTQPKPGQEILINGENFVESHYPLFGLDDPNTNVTGTLVTITPNGDQTSTATVIAERLSSEQLRLRIPINMIPGDYFVQVICEVQNAGGQLRKASNLRALEVGAHQFAVTFLKITCENSTPGSGADDIITLWTVAADDKVAVKKSSEYEDAFDVDREDGDSPVSVPYKISDAGVFPGVLDAATHGGEVRVGLAVMTQLIETDEEDNPAYEQVLGVVSSVAGAVAAVLGATGVGAGVAAVAGAVGAIAEAVSAIISGLTGGTDSLGTEPKFWTVIQLQEKTDNDMLSFEETLLFLWYEGTTYRVTFQIKRLPT